MMIKKALGKLISYGKDAKVPALSPGNGQNKLLYDKNGVLDCLEKVPTNVSGGVQNVISEIVDYLKVAELESTKREEICARRDVALASLRNQRDLFEQLMKFTFQERAVVIKKQFDILDTAMKNGDVVTIKNALDGMVSVIQTSPFSSVKEMQDALSSSNYVVRLD